MFPATRSQTTYGKFQHTEEKPEVSSGAGLDPSVHESHIKETYKGWLQT